MKRALICGISGQDGTYLAKLLLDKGYEVSGTSRDAQVTSGRNLKRMGIFDDIQLESMSLIDFRSVLQVLAKIKPDEIYNFAGLSSVGLSFEQPVETLESHAIGTLNLLESVRFLNYGSKIYNASSGDCFGDTGGVAAVETTPFRPRSPYGVAKAAAFWEVANYREAYNEYACSGILFNHESPIRPVRFVTRKIINAACKISRGEQDKLVLGDISIRRDWGWAPEYVKAMWMMMQQEQPDDYIIATGVSHSLEEFVDAAFSVLDLDWQAFVETSPSLLRPTDIREGFGDPGKAERTLGWKPEYQMEDVVKMMVSAELDLLSEA